MGASLIFSWFGKSLTELKSIRETEAKDLSKMELKQLDELIAKKEKEENE